jgi:hypothetical protein
LLGWYSGIDYCRRCWAFIQKLLAQMVCLLLNGEDFFPSYSWYVLKTLQQATPVVQKFKVSNNFN